MSSPTVSVIIAAYNCGELLPEAVESVRRQTYQDYELIVVDDGSTDETWSVIEQLARSFDKLRPIRAEHAGLAAARNRGLEAMRGQWIALLDADDLWLPEKLDRCMQFLACHPALRIVYTPMKPITRDGKCMKGHSKRCYAGWLTERLFESIFVHDPAAVLHKSVIETCGGFDETLPVCVGHEFWLRVSTKFEFGLIDEPLALRRWSQQTLTRSRRSLGRQIKARMLEQFYFEKGGKEIVARRAAMKRLADVHYSAGKILLSDGRWKKARSQLKKAIRFRRGHLKAYPFYVAACAASLFG